MVAGHTATQPRPASVSRFYSKGILRRGTNGPEHICLGLARGLLCLLARGPVLFELGLYAEAARNYEKLAAIRGMSPAPIEEVPSLLARHLTWMRAHALNAYV